MSYREFDVDTMALTVWGETRGETPKGQIAVAWVIKNRWLNPRWWSKNLGDRIDDDTIAAVCRDPWQFSCWNPADPNRPKLDDPKTKQRHDYQAIRELCVQVLNDLIPDPTNSADHYVVTKIINHVNWASRRKPCSVIGGHSFFRIEI